MNEQTESAPAPPPSETGLSCCAPHAQATCCEPSEKAGCCGAQPDSDRCGCR
jgi:arsenite methyltransferase